MADDELDDGANDDGAEGLEDPIMPVVPAELGIDPLLLALLHCAAFLDLAGEEEVDPDAAGDVLENLEVYVKRLPLERLGELQSQLEKLEGWAEDKGWPEELVDFVSDFLYSCGVGDEDEEDALGGAG
jgi:hypothetical protein